MFEQNNIGVRCSHPIAATIASLVPHKDSKLAKAILAGAEKIVEHMDGEYTRLKCVLMCSWIISCLQFGTFAFTFRFPWITRESNVR